MYYDLQYKCTKKIIYLFEKKKQNIEFFNIFKYCLMLNVLR